MRFSFALVCHTRRIIGALLFGLNAALMASRHQNGARRHQSDARGYLGRHTRRSAFQSAEATSWDGKGGVEGILLRGHYHGALKALRRGACCDVRTTCTLVIFGGWDDKRPPCRWRNRSRSRPLPPSLRLSLSLSLIMTRRSASCSKTWQMHQLFKRSRPQTSVRRIYFRGARILISFVHFRRDTLINAEA